MISAACRIRPRRRRSCPGSAGDCRRRAAATPFDAILTLEALAATCAALDPRRSAGRGRRQRPGRPADDDRLSDRTPTAKSRWPFCAGLAERSRAGTTAAFADRPPRMTMQSKPAIDDALGGQAQHAASPDGHGREADATPRRGAGDDDRGHADTMWPGRQAAAADGPGGGQRPVDAASTDPATPLDATAGLARAAEMLAHGPRHAAGRRATHRHAGARSALGRGLRRARVPDGARRRIVGVIAAVARGSRARGRQCHGARFAGQHPLRRRAGRNARAHRSVDSPAAGNAGRAGLQPHGCERLARVCPTVHSPDAQLGPSAAAPRPTPR